ncbi:D-arabinono-1,4-lactone oxidase [Aureispira anguillae]|uniref:FAD-binding PCMH-type domain-containing protein n=1 Tax=Aureispira anguillae TaxID=2864201 RepID=A0A915YFY4_9BACT|nr:D-arabinono-1,4-lactone oxidase [Aureispira anguillae]BDS12440.1 hypothetical protein AsAng_0031630 [Aureispira anguillae]
MKEAFKKSLNIEESKASDQAAIEQLLKAIQDHPSTEEEINQQAELVEPELDPDEFITNYVAPRGIIPNFTDTYIRRNKKVQNAVKTWSYKASYYLYPKSLKGLISCIQEAEKHGKKIRAIGSKHSFSNVVACEDWFVDLSLAHPYKGRNKQQHNSTVRKVDQTATRLLQTGLDRSYHFDVPGGLKIHMLNQILCPDKPNWEPYFPASPKRLFNMGGGDVQAFAGAFSTGTHGTGGKYTTYHDTIRSLLLVASGGKAYRLEPTNGITNPQKHQDYYALHPDKPKVELLQDDNKFYAALNNMGCFGIIYSCIIEITDMAILQKVETFKTSGWTPSFKATINEQILPEDIEQEAFFSIEMNPYTVGNNPYPSLLTKRSKPVQALPTNPHARGRNVWPALFTNWGLAVDLLRIIATTGKYPKRRIVETALRALDDKRGEHETNLAYKIWNAGTGRTASIGTAIEMAFPVEQITAVVDKVIQVLSVEGQKGRAYYLNAPMAIRFARPSEAFLAINYHTYKGKKVKLWAYLEILRVHGTDQQSKKQELELFQYLQDMLLILGGRPHWGLNFGFPFTQSIIKELYPEADKWYDAFHFFNASRVFDNAFSKQLGL